MKTTDSPTTFFINHNDYIKEIKSIEKGIADLQKRRKEVIDEFVAAYAPFKVGQKVLVFIPCCKVYNFTTRQNEVLPEQEKYAFVAENSYDEHEQKVSVRFVICKKDGTPGKKPFYVPLGAKIKPVNG